MHEAEAALEQLVGGGGTLAAGVALLQRGEPIDVPHVELGTRAAVPGRATPATLGVQFGLPQHHGAFTVHIRACTRFVAPCGEPGDPPFPRL